MSTDSVQCNRIHIYYKRLNALLKVGLRNLSWKKIYITKCGGLSISWFSLTNFFPWALTVHLASLVVLPQGQPVLYVL